MKSPKSWSREELYKHLQEAIDLELWTVPLYLTAAYSIKGLRSTPQKDYPEAAKLVISVVVQEMLHIELVCNLCNALGYAPKFNLPHYDAKKGIPFIHPEDNHLPPTLDGFTVKSGALDENSLKLFCAIEFPHLGAETEWTEKQRYDSISEFYLAIKEAIHHHWDEFYIGDAGNLKQKFTFKEYGGPHGFSQKVNSRETAELAIEAIIEQGEGSHDKHVPEDFQPHIPKNVEEHASWFKGDWSHFDKFNYLLHHPELVPEVYSGREELHSEDNLALKEHFKNMLLEMEKEFNKEGEDLDQGFWSLMMQLGHHITAIWEKGIVPSF